jgi:hypothetical protein
MLEKIEGQSMTVTALGRQDTGRKQKNHRNTEN